MLFNKKWLQVIALGVVLFALVFFVLGFAVEKIWFREDDLGTILNGIIRSWRDFLRVFSSDCRSFITPVNYQRTVPNFISGFLRPMQNVIFSVVYFFGGVDPWAYYLTHVVFHAANATLFFAVCSLWLPLRFSFFSGMMFAFYPDVSWLTWIGTVQNSLAVFFLLLSVFFFYLFISSTRFLWYLLSGIMFLFSILSRESAIFLPFALWFGVFIWQTKSTHSFWMRCWKALEYSWIFFLGNVVYTLMRIWAFGFSSIDRTINNLFIRYPWLLGFIGTKTKIVSPVTSSVASKSVVVKTVEVLTPTHICSWFYVLKHKCTWFFCRLGTWLEAIFAAPLNTVMWQVLALVACLLCGVFLYQAHRGQWKVFISLLGGLVCLSWPGVLAYPSPRYLNMIYPLLIFIFVYGVYRLNHSLRYDVIGRILSVFILCGMGLMAIKGVFENRKNLAGVAYERYVYKQRFDRFFSSHSFSPNTRFVLISSPFVSDVQSIFQAYLESNKVTVVFDLFSTLAEKGVMGCRKDYRVTGVRSEIIPIEGGFRLVSRNKNHCGWWLRFSDFPIKWNSSGRAYEWSEEPYCSGNWNLCSIGRYKINQMVDSDCATDISFVFDRRWIDETTVFVAWDTTFGEYVVLQVDHL